MKTAILTLLASLMLGQLFATRPEEAILKAMDGPLEGFRFNKRLAAPSLKEHVLLFSRNDSLESRIVAWTENSGDRFAAFPTSPTAFTVLNVEGETVEEIPPQSDYSLVIKLTREPLIYVPASQNRYLEIAAAAERVQSPVRISGPQTVELTCTFTNPLDEDLFFTVEEPAEKAVIKPGGRFTVTREVEVGRPAEPLIVPVEGMGIVQQVVVEVRNPLKLEIWPEQSQAITLRLENPAQSPFKGEGEINLVTGMREQFQPFRFDLTMSPRDSEKTLRIPLNYDGVLPFPVRVTIKQRSSLELGKEYVLCETAPTQFSPLRPFESESATKTPRGYEARSEGKSYWQFTAGKPAEGVPNPSTGSGILVYNFQPGGLGIKVRPTADEGQEIIGQPMAYGIWVFSDNSGNFVTCGIRDANGRVFQPDPVKLDWKGWRYLRFYWPEDMQPPLRWESMIELIYADETPNGAIYVNNPVLVYTFTEREEPETAAAPPEEEPVIIDRRGEAPSAIPVQSLPME